MADLTTSNPALPDVPPATDAPETSAHDPTEKLNEDIEKHFKSQVESSEKEIKQYLGKWKRNIDLRMGQPFGPYSSYFVEADDEYQSELNPDWYLTKTKVANLFSQVPAVRLTHENRQYEPAIGPFQKALNYELSDKRCNIGAAMYECLNDIVNAAGIGAIHTGYAARFEDKEIPAVDVSLLPPQQVIVMLANQELPMKTVPFQTDGRFFTKRISPPDLLIPKGFTGSDFDAAPWLGERFKTSWSEAKSEWHLDEALEDELHGDDEGSGEESLRANKGGADKQELKQIKGKRVYYWRYRVDPECHSFTEIWEIVWLDGKSDGKPVYHEPWKGQQFIPETGKYVGACRLPIQVCTITYITDNPRVPSDSEAGRPQVNDLRRSRSQMFQNRMFSLPVRWFNTDKTDPSMHDLLMKGRFQGMIPVQGRGHDLMGELARASYPQENLTFDQNATTDLHRTWGFSPNQLGQLASHETTGKEASLAQQGFNTTMGLEKSQVAKFFLGCVEVLAGLMALYSDFPNLSQKDRLTMMQAWDNKHILHDLAFKILPDSQVVLDVESRIARLSRMMNLTVKSGFVNPQPMIAELIQLHGYDPAEYMIQPQPHPMKPMSLSFSFKGKEDLMNPFVMALMARNQQLPTPEEVETARQILMRLSMGLPMKDPPPPQRPGVPGVPPRRQLGPGGAGPVPGQDMQPQWSLANKVAKRSREVSGNA